MNGYFFRSSLFKIELGEDDATNPFCYGKQLSEWIRVKFLGLGYPVEEVIPEDWGFCVVLQRDPFKLCIGCGTDRAAFYNSVSPEEKETFIPSGEDVLWHCIPIAEVSLWTRIFRNTDCSGALSTVDVQLLKILENERHIDLQSVDDLS